MPRCDVIQLGLPGGDLLTVKILLEDAADLNAVDNTGRTPLMFAAGAGHLEAVLKGCEEAVKDPVR